MHNRFPEGEPDNQAPSEDWEIPPKSTGKKELLDITKQYAADDFLRILRGAIARGLERPQTNQSQQTMLAMEIWEKRIIDLKAEHGDSPGRIVVRFEFGDDNMIRMFPSIIMS